MSKTKSKLKEFNPQLKLLFEENNIKVDDGFTFLLSLYFKLNSDFFSETFVNKINSLGIYFINTEQNIIEWKISLFEEVDDKFEWVNEYRDKFKKANSGREGTKQVVINRMKKLFSMYPHIRKDDVLKATDMYLNSINDHKYITTAERFLFQDRDGSPILDWIEKIQESQNDNSHNLITDLI